MKTFDFFERFCRMRNLKAAELHTFLSEYIVDVMNSLEIGFFVSETFSKSLQL